MGHHTVNYKFIAAHILTASKTLIYRMKRQRAGGEQLADQVERQDASDATSIGVHPDEAMGLFYETDLALGKGESADDIIMTDAVCSVSTSKNIVKTALVGLSGTIKEYISQGDYEVSIIVGLVAVEDGKVVDKYPADGVRDLRELLDHTEALYVDSEFLRLFDITRLVIVDYTIEQMTHSNRQIINIRAISDEDFEIKHNEY